MIPNEQEPDALVFELVKQIVEEDSIDEVCEMLKKWILRQGADAQEEHVASNSREALQETFLRNTEAVLPANDFGGDA